VRERRINFVIARRFARPRQFVLLDESGAKTNMTRLYGRSPVGERCRFHTPHGHWRTSTILSAVRTSGIVREATLLLDGPMDAVTFLGYTERMLAPTLAPGDIVVMDNLGAHKAAGVAEAIGARGADVWYLPPYSPDLNPIERVWAKVKAWLRRVAARDFAGLADAIADALRAVSVDECTAYFRGCGYGT
jgi:transposase